MMQLMRNLADRPDSLHLVTGVTPQVDSLQGMTAERQVTALNQQPRLQSSSPARMLCQSVHLPAGVQEPFPLKQVYATTSHPNTPPLGAKYKWISPILTLAMSNFFAVHLKST